MLWPEMSLNFSAVTAPFRMQPGLRKLAPGHTQLTPLAAGDAVFAEKLAVLSLHPEQALAVAGGFDAVPALRAVCEQACTEHPEAFSLDARGFAAHRLGWRVEPATGRLEALPQAHAGTGRCLDALPATWRLAGLLCLSLHEDFAIVDGAEATIPWLAVCLPSHWAPTEKVGRHFAQVHAPVADNATLLAAGEHLMKLVCAAQRWERFVWTFTPSAQHDQHPQRQPRRAWPPHADMHTLAMQTWLRCERQSFIPLPQRQQAVFLIHVDMRPLARAAAEREHARRLHDALASMSDAVLAYRGLAEPRERLLAWLAERAA